MPRDAAEARRGPPERPRPPQRRIIAPSRQRVTLRVTWRTRPIRFSMPWVVAKHCRRRSGSPSVNTVRVSSRPSRRLAAASTCPLASSQVPRAFSWRRAAVALGAR